MEYGIWKKEKGKREKEKGKIMEIYDCYNHLAMKQ